MIKKNSISIAYGDGADLWEEMVKRELGFAEVFTSTPQGVDEGLLSGTMAIDEFINGGLKVQVNSSAQKTSLVHRDAVNNENTKFIILNSCGSLRIRNSDHRETISMGDSMLVPLWEPYVEECFSERVSLSFIFDVEQVADSDAHLSELFWRKCSTFEYGVEINKIISNFYNNHNDTFCEKNVKVLQGLLSLEIENLRVPPKKEVQNKCSYIINFIRNNLKKGDLRLSELADSMGVTVRTVQYTLSNEKMSFHQLLSTERCRFLASKIRSNLYCDICALIYESGFSSVASANRQFKRVFNVTPKQYQKRLMLNLNVNNEFLFTVNA